MSVQGQFLYNCTEILRKTNVVKTRSVCVLDHFDLHFGDFGLSFESFYLSFEGFERIFGNLAIEFWQLNATKCREI